MLPSDQRDGVDVTAIILLAPMGRAAETEKSRRIGVGAQREILDLRDGGPHQPRPDIAGEIEQGMAGARRRAEEAIAAGILRGKARDQIGADFVIVLPDHRSERGVDLAAFGAKPFHGLDRRLGDAGERAAPAGMRGADHAGDRIGEKDRAAIGGRHANGETGEPVPPLRLV